MLFNCLFIYLKKKKKKKKKKIDKPILKIDEEFENYCKMKKGKKKKKKKKKKF